jgi:chromate transporter
MSVSLREATRVWAKIGCLSFGGPAGQIALMHRELVEQRRWISEERFLHALNYCMLLPGPEAQQLATYIGWLLHRTWGGIVSGALFVLPGFLTMLALSALYVSFGKLPAVEALFFGLKTAVLAIVIEAVVRIGRRALTTAALVLTAAGAFIAAFLFRVPFPLIVAGAALLGALLAGGAIRMQGANGVDDDRTYLVDRLHAEGRLRHAEPSRAGTIRTLIVCCTLWFAPLLLAWAVLGAHHIITREGVFFSQAAVVTFGGAYAVLAYVGQYASMNAGWITPGQMLDGLALAETTPGPLILVLQFVGFLAAFQMADPLNPWLAAVLAASLTVWVTFLPSFLFIFVGAPHVESVRQNRRLAGALAGVTAAVVGVILNLSAWFALHTLFGRLEVVRFAGMTLELPAWRTLETGALLLSMGALIAMFRFRAGMASTLAGCAVLGAAYWWWRHAS